MQRPPLGASVHTPEPSANATATRLVARRESSDSMSGGRPGGDRGHGGTSDSGAGGPEGESRGGPGEYKGTSRFDLDRSIDDPGR